MSDSGKIANPFQMAVSDGPHDCPPPSTIYHPFTTKYLYLYTQELVVNQDCASEITEQIRLVTLGSSNNHHHAHGDLVCVPGLSCDEHGQYQCNFPLYKEAFGRLLDTILINVKPLTNGEDITIASKFTFAGSDEDCHAIMLKQYIGPGRHYAPTTYGMLDTGYSGGSGTHPNTEHLITLMQLAVRLLEVRKVFQRAQEFFSLMERLQDIIEIFIHDNHEAGAAAISMLMYALDDEELALDDDVLAADHIDPLSVAMDVVEIITCFGETQENSPCAESYWKASPSSSAITRQVRLHVNEGPLKSLQIKRFTPSDGITYFDFDTDSFTRGGIRPGITNCIRNKAISAAEKITRLNLGITFRHTEKQHFSVFSIRYDPDLDYRAYAESFFPADPVEMWQLRVRTIAENLCIHKDVCEFTTGIFLHEFAHILGLRHHNCHICEPQEPSQLWPNTTDENEETIMRTEVAPSELQFFEEDCRVIRELYSMENGDLVACDGSEAYIVDINPSDERRRFNRRRRGQSSGLCPR